MPPPDMSSMTPSIPMDTHTILYVLMLIIVILILILCWSTQRKLKTLEWYMVDIYDAVTALAQPAVVVAVVDKEEEEAAAEEEEVPAEEEEEVPAEDAAVTGSAASLKASGEMCNRIRGPSKTANTQCGIKTRQVGASASLKGSGEMCNRIVGPNKVANVTCGITAPLPEMHQSTAQAGYRRTPLPEMHQSTAGIPSINRNMIANYQSDRSL